MKKLRFAAAFSCLLLTGCGSSATRQAAAPPIEEQQASEAGQTAAAQAAPLRIGKDASPFYYQLSQNADDLAAYSDVILEFTVSETECFKTGDLIATAITPEIIAVYKGNYQGETVYNVGGEMNLLDYYQSCSAREKAYIGSHTEEEMQNGTFYYYQEGHPWVQSGERYLFFGTYIESGDYAGQLAPLFEADGFFACDDDTVYLDREMYNEALKKALTEQFAVPEKNTDAMLACSKADLIACVTR